MPLLTLGFDANDPRMPVLRKHFRAREYRTRIYRVRWTEMDSSREALDDRPLAPEIALL